MKWFHRHTFDPEKWELIRIVTLCSDDYNLPVGQYQIFTNTCLNCGDLIRKKLKT
jgi:hypothetical protein